MPINKSLMDSLVKKYGKKEGEKRYFAMENSKNPAFQKGVKTASKEGHTVSDLKTYNTKKVVKKSPDMGHGKAYQEAMQSQKDMAGIRQTISTRMGIKPKKKVKKGGE